MNRDDIIKENQMIDREVFGVTNIDNVGNIKMSNSDIVDELQEIKGEVNDLIDITVDIKKEFTDVADGVKEKLDELGDKFGEIKDDTSYHFGSTPLIVDTGLKYILIAILVVLILILIKLN